MPTGLIVPIHVAAQCADKRNSVTHLQQSADFSKVPYYASENYEESDIRNRGPYTSHRILAETTVALSEGVHLHWSLPAGLCQGQVGENSEHADFPVAPNRWMVTRIIVNRNNSTEVSRKSWVMESDRLNKDKPDAAKNLSPPPPAVPVYAEDGDADSGEVGGLQSFRYLGQFFEASQCQESSESVRTSECREYLGKARKYTNQRLAKQSKRARQTTSKVAAPYELSAVGYGELSFASSYTDCGGVFGFCDQAGDLAQSGYVAANHLLGYHVVGWFSDADDDPVVEKSFKLGPPARPRNIDDESVAAYDASYQEYLDSGLSLEEGKSCCYGKEQKWLFTAAEALQPDFSLYSGVVLNVGWNPNQTYDPPTELEAGNDVAIGNTQAEALAAWLAAKLNRSGIASDEEMLNALQLGALPVLDEPSGIIKLRRLMHQSYFGTVPGGTIVLVEPKEGDSEARRSRRPRTAARPPVPPAFAQKLDDLNRVQWQHDELVEEIRSLKQQIAADWQKYQYIARTGYDEMPNGSIPKQWLNEDGNAAGTVRGLINAQIKVHDNRAADISALEAEISVKRAHVEREFVSLGLADHYDLKFEPAPRYHHAAEPVVILSGPALRPAAHFGQESRLREDEFLECRLSPPASIRSQAPFLAGSLLHPFSQAVTESISALVEEASQLIAGKQAPETIPAHSVAVSTSVNEWIPLRLQWTVEYNPFHPIENRENYPTSLVLDHYRIDFEEADLSPISGSLSGDGSERAVVPAKKAAPGAKSSPALPADSGMTETQSGNARYRATIPLSPDATINLQSQIDEYVDQLDDGPLKGKLVRFRDQLDDSPILGRSLEGINPALVMLKQSYQLPIDDPLWDTETERDFCQKVRQVVDRSGDLGEESSYSFNPIRAGHLLVSSLTVVDCFGRRLNIPVGNMIVARSMLPSITGGNWVGLPPRIVPPSRLLFRWISAQDQQRSAVSDLENPVCGWIMFNRLDNSLLIYNDHGAFLGSLILIERENQNEVLWQGAPDSPHWGGSSESALRGENHYLRSFVQRLENGGADFLKSFLHAVDRTLTLSLNKLPVEANSSILLSKPLALVRASMKLDLLDLPPVSQRWEEFKRVAQASKSLPSDAPIDQIVPVIQRTTAAFENVRMPVRLGELADITDGLVGFFKGDDFQQFYAAAAKPGEHSQVTPPTDATLALNCNPKTPEANMTMLVDPYGEVRATMGILPVQGLKLSPDHYIETLQRIEATFLISPVIGRHVPVVEGEKPGRATDIVDWAMIVAAPDEALEQGEWSWLEQPRPRTWTATSITPPFPQVAASYSPQTVREGWLRLKHVPEREGTRRGD